MARIFAVSRRASPHRVRRLRVLLGSLVLLITVACYGGAEPFRDPITSALDRAVRRQVTRGHIAFAAPKLMKVNATRTVEARIGFEVPAKLTTRVREDLTEGLAEIGQPEIEDVLVSKTMLANLVGPPEITITRATPEEVVIPKRGFARWRWLLTPTEDGNHVLTLTVTALVHAEPLGDRHATVDVLERQIKVQALPFSFVGWLRENVEWIASLVGILLGVLGILGWQRGKRRKEDEKGQGGEEG
jgi:hypothetical protein